MMKEAHKKILVVLMILTVGFSPTTIFAQEEAASEILLTNFGGFLTFAYPCTCSAGVFAVYYDVKTQQVLPLVFQYGYSYVNTVQNYASLYIPSTYALGKYSSTGTYTCEIYAIYTCIDIGSAASGIISTFPVGVGFGGIPVDSLTSVAGFAAGSALGLGVIEDAFDEAEEESGGVNTGNDFVDDAIDNFTNFHQAAAVNDVVGVVDAAVDQIENVLDALGF